MCISEVMLLRIGLDCIPSNMKKKFIVRAQFSVLVGKDRYIGM